MVSVILSEEPQVRSEGSSIKNCRGAFKPATNKSNESNKSNALRFYSKTGRTDCPS